MTPISNKLRGGYYTPANASALLARWAIRSPEATVLEPSCGDGSILNAAIERLLELGGKPGTSAAQVTGVELIPEEAQKARRSGASVLCGDFFSYCKNGQLAPHYDAVVGNPPFIRYQDFKEEYREIAFGLMRSFGFTPSRLTNIWIPFLTVCCHLVADGGRLGMVIPAELFQVNYARETREFLLSYFNSITLITFDGLLFDDAQQEVVLLLAEKSDSSHAHGIRVVEASNVEGLAAFGKNPDFSALPISNALSPEMKWQSYYLDPSVLELLQEVASHSLVKRLSDIAEINVGLVSGQNSFFVINDTTAEHWGIRADCAPIVSRSMQLDGLAFNAHDMKLQERLDRKVLLFNPCASLSDNAIAYIAEGERLGHQTNYKCRIRNPWYKVPTSWKGDAFFYRQVGSFPRIVMNEAGAFNTDTLHKVRFNKGVDKRLATVSFNNSLTYAMSELLGRSYGGGVLTFEPSEARNMPLPFSSSADLDFEKADHLAREGKIDELLDYVDDNLLVSQMGLSHDDVRRIRSAWIKLRDRRLGRKTR